MFWYKIIYPNVKDSVPSNSITFKLLACILVMVSTVVPNSLLLVYREKKNIIVDDQVHGVNNMHGFAFSVFSITYIG